MADYKLPDPGEGLTEAEIVTWRVAVGDTVEINDIVVEIETAKSLVELPSPYAGTVTALLVAEGETVEVGTPIISIGDPAEAPAEAPASPAGRAGSDETEVIDTNKPPEGNPTLVGYGPREGAAKRRTRKAAAPAATKQQVQGAFDPAEAPAPEAVEEAEEEAEPVAEEPAAVEPPAAPAPPSGPRALAKPPVRKLAKDLGVDLAALTPTGPNGSVSRDDVQRAATAVGGADAATAVEEGADAATAVEEGAKRPSRDPGTDEWREPVKGVGKMMAQAMVGSAFTAPHVTEWVTVDVTGAMSLVERLRARRELREVKVSALLVLARAVTLAMRRTPIVNSWFDTDAQEVLHRRHVNLGIAAATPRGLVVPNVKGADAMTLPELATALGELTETARAGRTQPAQMSGGTFTITNVGPFGVDGGTPIINPGESAILCFGAVRKQPWVVTTDGVDEIVPRQVATLALSFDHRHIDGEAGSRFLADVAAIMEDPGTALLF